MFRNTDIIELSDDDYTLDDDVVDEAVDERKIEFITELYNQARCAIPPIPNSTRVAIPIPTFPEKEVEYEQYRDGIEGFYSDLAVAEVVHACYALADQIMLEKGIEKTYFIPFSESMVQSAKADTIDSLLVELRREMLN